MNSKDTPSATSSPGSPDGPSLFNLLDGLLTVLFGQEAVPVSRSAVPGRDSPKRTNGTSGLSSLTSSASAALSRSLVNRLQARLGTDGSMEYRQTWKQKATPAGRPYWAHIPSNRPINDSASTGWPTTGAGDEKCRISNLGMAEKLLASGKQTSLELVAHMTGWPTPVANDDNKSPEAHLAMKIRMGERDGTGANRTAITSLQVMAKTITGWSSPTVGDAASARNSTANRKSVPPTGVHAGNTLTDLADISGLTSNSSTAETGKPAAYQLNPHFSRWLMGFPPEWCDCAVTAMQSFLSVRKPSSKRSSK